MGNERVSTRRAHRIGDSLARGVDNEVAQGSAGRRGGSAGTGYSAGDLRRARYQDHERACVERPCTSAGVDTAAGDDKPNDAVAEGKDGAQDDDGVSASEKALLGPTHVGTRIFLL